MSPHFAWANCFLTNSSRRTCSFAFCMNNLSFISNPFLVRKVFENPIELVFLKTLSSLLYFFFLHLCLTGLLGFLNVLLQLFLLFFETMSFGCLPRSTSIISMFVLFIVEPNAPFLRRL